MHDPNPPCRLLSAANVLASYDVVCQAYPSLPTLQIWRSWEYAAYKGLALAEPVLDVGCGDGVFFSLVWPGIKQAYGVDLDSAVIELARQSANYVDVQLSSADKLPYPDSSFASVFANCSLEHMNDLNSTLREVRRCLKRGGGFVLSVVTNRFVEWLPLPWLAEHIGDNGSASAFRRQYLAYHNLTNALSTYEWRKVLEDCGFAITEYVPLIPLITSTIFLMLDSAWHVPHCDGELGAKLTGILSEGPSANKPLRALLAWALAHEHAPHDTSGLVIHAKAC